ncbi:hypothetical protein EC396_05110 [Lutibacter sp. HS1-25]|uniref:hypothetical protein n=1 Tax=Lutibacter sp. HS1-25 TaxID=2485000 RepID=UPI001013B9CB|nr:hypothetical protein [Lutibacter sp. HS1-25]RXP59429.1 hypothetical protein EC396_05110 [Lutibacter sp. HS1-25]
MKTIATCVEEILVSQPFLEDALTRNILNYSALSEELMEPISKMLRKHVKAGAIMMALRRYSPPKEMANKVRLENVLKNLGDITVRSDLSDYTFKNSPSLIQSHLKTLDIIKSDPHIFYTFTRGVHESNVLITTALKEKIETFYKKEDCTSVQDNLSAITIGLPKDNTKIAGLYYQFFKRLAWEGISLYEVVSTTNEFTILVEDDVVDKAFSAIKGLKN